MRGQQQKYTVDTCRKNTWPYEMSVNKEMFFINKVERNVCKISLKYIFLCISVRPCFLINTIEQCRQGVLNFSNVCKYRTIIKLNSAVQCKFSQQSFTQYQYLSHTDNGFFVKHRLCPVLC